MLVEGLRRSPATLKPNKETFISLLACHEPLFKGTSFESTMAEQLKVEEEVQIVM